MLHGHRGRSLRSAGLICVALVAVSAVAGAAGFGLARYLDRTPLPELPADAAGFCGGEPTELCRLRHANYRLAWSLGQHLAREDCMVATAESITVGGFASTFGRTRWAGRVLAGGAVTYATAAKNVLLDVPETSDRGVISERTARDMVLGLRELLDGFDHRQSSRAQSSRLCHFVAFTGAATRWGDMSPRVHIGLAGPDGDAVVVTRRLRGDIDDPGLARRTNIELAVHLGLKLLEERMFSP